MVHVYSETFNHLMRDEVITICHKLFESRLVWQCTNSVYYWFTFQLIIFCATLLLVDGPDPECLQSDIALFGKTSWRF